jgi:hypothetical protein
VIPTAIAIEQVSVVDELLTAEAVVFGAGISSDRLDRPPRPLL